MTACMNVEISTQICGDGGYAKVGDCTSAEAHVRRLSV